MSTKQILLIIWIIDYVYVWFLVYQEFEIEKTYKPLLFRVPSVCKEDLKWYKKLWNKLTLKSKNDCLTFYKQQKIDTIWKITPFIVFNRQIETNILIWSQFVGKSVSYIASGCTSETNWLLNVYITPLIPIILIIVYIFFCAIVSFLLNRKFSFKLWNVASINFYNTFDNKRKKEKYPLYVREKSDVDYINSKPVVEESILYKPFTENFETNKENCNLITF